MQNVQLAYGKKNLFNIKQNLPFSSNFILKRKPNMSVYFNLKLFIRWISIQYLQGALNVDIDYFCSRLNMKFSGESVISNACFSYISIKRKPHAFWKDKVFLFLCQHICLKFDDKIQEIISLNVKEERKGKRITRQRTSWCIFTNHQQDFFFSFLSPSLVSTFLWFSKKEKYPHLDTPFISTWWSLYLLSFFL